MDGMPPEKPLHLNRIPARGPGEVEPETYLPYPIDKPAVSAMEAAVRLHLLPQHDIMHFEGTGGFIRTDRPERKYQKRGKDTPCCEKEHSSTFRHYTHRHR